MPLYEYQCPRCGRFEIIRKFSDAPLSACPRCGGEVQKLLSAPAIQFKGSGWYVTDYARKGAGGDGTAKDGASKEGASKESAAKESPAKDSPAASKDSSSAAPTESTTKSKPASGGGSTS